jgi:hypothetical protein
MWLEGVFSGLFDGEFVEFFVAFLKRVHDVRVKLLA